MFQALSQAAGDALIERVVLFVNHVLAAEPQAAQRMAPHAGRFIGLQLNDWPKLLPPLPVLVFCVTPAGLLEWAPQALTTDLQLTVAAGDPLRLVAQGLMGERPPVDVRGDSHLAADISWLMDHLRWDAADDLARVVGPVAAREMARVGSMLAAGLRDAMRGVQSVAQKLRPQETPAR